jgi:hypothetical protein
MKAAQAAAAAAAAPVQQVADTVKEGIDALAKGIYDAFPPPVKFYFDCGCQVAGTVAFIKNSMAELGEGLNACGDLLGDPIGLITEIFNDPAAVAGAIKDAACGAAKETIGDVCGYAEKIYDLAKDVAGYACDLDVTGACNALGETLGEAWSDVKCLFKDCPNPYAALLPAPVCDDQWHPGGPYCVCDPLKVLEKSDKYVKNAEYQTDYGAATTIVSGLTCKACAITQSMSPDRTHCEECPQGYHQDPATGLCTVAFSCEYYKADNSDCLVCNPPYSYNASHTACERVCVDPVAWAASHTTPPNYSGCSCPAGTYDTGHDCQVAISCDILAGLIHDSASNTCVPGCEDPRYYYGKTGGQEIAHCIYCGDGKTAKNNQCGISCDWPLFRVSDDADSCTHCPDGTKPDANGSCGSICAPGSAPKATMSGLQKSLGTLTPNSAALGSQSVSQNALMTPFVSGGRSGARSSGGDATLVVDDQCVPCAENEYSGSTILQGDGYAIIQTYCVSCPPGEVSKTGSAECHKPLYFEVIPGLATTPARPVNLTPSGPVSAVPLTAEPKGKKKASTGTQKAKGTVCPEGQVMTTSGGCQPAKGKLTTVNPKVQLPKERIGSDAAGKQQKNIQTFTPGIQTKTGPAPKTTPTFTTLPGVRTTPPGSGFKTK